MQRGTKSLLFWLHQFAIHPTFVLVGWVKLYHKLPNWKESICILIHDWGYWGKPNIDGPEGDNHPIWAAWWAWRHLDKAPGKYGGEKPYYDLCMFHSGTMANRCEQEPSKLCIPDKYGSALVPVWLMVLLGRLSGETEEIKHAPKYAHAHREVMTDWELYSNFKNYYVSKVVKPFKADFSKNKNEAKTEP